MANMCFSYVSTRLFQILISFAFIIHTCTAHFTGVQLETGPIVTFFDPTDNYMEYRKDLTDGAVLVCAIGPSKLVKRAATEPAPADGVFYTYFDGEQEHSGSYRLYCLGPEATQELPKDNAFMLTDCLGRYSGTKGTGFHVYVIC